MSTRELAHTLIDELDETQLQGFITLFSKLMEDLSGLGKYEDIMKSIRNAEYLAMIDKGISEIENGTCFQHDLIEVDDE